MAAPRRPRRGGGARAALIGLIAGALLAVTAPAASADPWQCDAYGYLFQSPSGDAGPHEVHQVDLATGEATVMPGETDNNLNAVGYNAVDDYFYAWDLENQELVSVNDDLTLNGLGVPTGPGGTVNTPIVYNMGDVDPSGHFWLASAGGATWYEIDLTAGTPTVVSSGTWTSPPGFAGGADWAWVDGALHRLVVDVATQEAHIQRFDPATETWSDPHPGGLGFTVAAGDNAGALYADASGYLYASMNQSGDIHRIDPVTGDAILANDDGPAASNNDGARCAAAAIPTITVTKTVVDRASSADQFTVGLEDDGGTVLTSATTTGTDTTVSTTDWPVSPGATYTITDAMAAGSPSPLSAYTTTIACVDGAGDPVSTGGTAPNWTLTVSDATDYSCEVTNTGPTPPPPPGPWACDGTGYITQYDSGGGTGGDTLLQRAERQPDDSYAFTELGRIEDEHVNALAFRPQDGFMYAYDNTTSQIVRIASDASGDAVFTKLTPTGMPASFTTVIGTVLADGTYFMWGSSPDFNGGTGGTGGLIVDVSDDTTPVVTETVTAGTANFGGDLAVSPVDGALYGASSTDTYELEIAGGQLNEVDRVADSAGGGGLWFLPDGRLIQYRNTAGTMWSIDLDSGDLTQIGTAPVASNVDGTSCPNSLAVTKDASPRTVTVGEQLTYSYTVTSRGLADNEVDFVDTLPAGMTYVDGGVTVTPSSFGTPNAYADTDTLEISGTLPPNDSVTITATVQVAPDAACDTGIDNQAQATASPPGLPAVTIDSDDPTTPDNPEDATTVQVDCSADLSIAKAAPATVEPETAITWTMTVANDGPGASTGSTVTDVLPADVADLATSTPGCTITGVTLTCAVGPLAAGASTDVTVTGTAPAGDDVCVTNSATVLGVEADPDAANNAASATTCTAVVPPPVFPPPVDPPPVDPPPVNPPPVNPPPVDPPPVQPPPGGYDLSLEKSVSSRRVSVGGTLTYTLVARNAGPGEAVGVLVNDSVPAHLEVRGAEASQGECSVTGSEVSCAIGTLAADQAVTVTVTTVALRLGGVANTAVVVPPPLPDGVAEVDPPVNNTSTAASRVMIEPRLRVAKRVSDRTVQAGQAVVYRIRIRNPSDHTVRRVRVCDRLPSGLVAVASKPRGTLRNGRFCWAAGRLSGGQAKTYRLKVRALAGTSGRKVNRVRVTSPDARAGAARRAIRVRDAQIAGGGVTG